MSEASSKPRSGKRLKIAMGLLLVAGVVWTIQLARLARTSPIRQHIEAGRQYALQGQARLAEQEWKAAIHLDPDNKVAWELLAELYYSTENWQPGIPAFEKLLRLRPDRPETHSQLAVCLLRSGDEKTSLREAQAELKRNPNDVTALIITALLLAKMGSLDEERVYLDRLRKILPDNPFVLSLTAENLTYTHNYAAAMPILEHLIKLEPNNSEAYALRGMCRFNKEMTPQGLAQAEADLNRALELNPFMHFARLYLGKVYRRQGQTARALFQLEEAQRLVPTRRDVLFELAGTYEMAGQPQKAAEVRRQFETLQHEADLQASLEKKCAVYPDNFDAHLQLGLICLKKRDHFKAEIFLKRAESLRPGDARAQAALKQLTASKAEAVPGESIQDKAASAARKGLLR